MGIHLDDVFVSIGASSEGRLEMLQTHFTATQSSLSENYHYGRFNLISLYTHVALTGGHFEVVDWLASEHGLYFSEKALLGMDLGEDWKWDIRPELTLFTFLDHDSFLGFRGRTEHLKDALSYVSRHGGDLAIPATQFNILGTGDYESAIFLKERFTFKPALTDMISFKVATTRLAEKIRSLPLACLLLDEIPRSYEDSDMWTYFYTEAFNPSLFAFNRGLDEIVPHNDVRPFLLYLTSISQKAGDLLGRDSILSEWPPKSYKPYLQFESFGIIVEYLIKERILLPKKLIVKTLKNCQNGRILSSLISAIKSDLSLLNQEDIKKEIQKSEKRVQNL